MKPFVRIAGRAAPWFQICGGAGWLGALCPAAILRAQLSLSAAMLCEMALGAAGIFFVFAWTAKLSTGSATLVSYRHQVAVTGVWIALLRLRGLPVLPYLDAAAVGLGIFLTFGRLGCLLAGCCYGRPCRRGIRYGEQHCKTGFPARYVGLRLFPVQALQGLWNLGLVICCWRLARNGQPGDAFCGYVCGYALGRFCLESLRGDPGRPRWAGITEAQWTAVATTLALCAAAWRGWVPRHWWCAASAALLALASIALAFHHRMRGRFALFDAWHLWEMAGAIETVTQGNCEEGTTIVSETSRGLRFSGSISRGGDESIGIVAFSRVPALCGDSAARRIGRFIEHVSRWHPAGRSQLVCSDRNVFQLLMPLGAARAPRFLFGAESALRAASRTPLFLRARAKREARGA